MRSMPGDGLLEADEQDGLGAVDDARRPVQLDAIARVPAAEELADRGPDRGGGRRATSRLTVNVVARCPGKWPRYSRSCSKNGSQPCCHVVEELLLPVGADAERRRHDAHDARPAGAGLDEELADERRDGTGLLAGDRRDVLLVGEAVRRVPADDVGGGVLGSHVGHEPAAEALLGLGGQEPGADAGRGGERVPDLLGRAGDLDLELETEGDVGGGHHDCSSGSSEKGPAAAPELIGRGWAATTRRCGRPSSWW